MVLETDRREAEKGEVKRLIAQIAKVREGIPDTIAPRAARWEPAADAPQSTSTPA